MKLLSTLFIALASYQAHSATIFPISFADFGSDAAGNTITANGATANLTVIETTGNNYSYSFTYSNQDFDGDGLNDTLTFITTVEGFRGGTIATSLNSGVDVTGTNGSATIGTTDRAVTSSGDGWAVQNRLLNPGESLVFNISAINVTLTDTTKTATACATGFTNAHFRENRQG